MTKFEADTSREDILKDINMTLEEYESGTFPEDVRAIILYEALVSAYHYIKETEE